MTKRLWQRVGIGLIVIGFGLFVWVQADPVSTISGAVAWGIVLLAYVVAMLVWAAAGVPHLFKRYFGQRRPSDGPEADYDDGPPTD